MSTELCRTFDSFRDKWGHHGRFYKAQLISLRLSLTIAEYFATVRFASDHHAQHWTTTPVNRKPDTCSYYPRLCTPKSAEFVYPWPVSNYRPCRPRRTRLWTQNQTRCRTIGALPVPNACKGQDLRDLSRRLQRFSEYSPRQAYRIPDALILIRLFVCNRQPV